MSDEPETRSAKAELKVRVAPALRRAIKTRATAEGLSMNGFVVHVLAAAVGPEFFRIPERSDDQPRTIAESRAQAQLRRDELQEARAVFMDHLVELGPGKFRRFTDEEAVEYWREVWLPARRAFIES